MSSLDTTPLATSTRSKRAHPSPSNDSKKRARLSATSDTIVPDTLNAEPSTGIIFYILLALLSAFIFLLFTAAMVSTRANAHLFRKDNAKEGRSTTANAKGEDQASDGEESALDCTREVMQRIIRRMSAPEDDGCEHYGCDGETCECSSWSVTSTPLTDATMTAPPTPMPSPCSSSPSTSDSDSNSNAGSNKSTPKSSAQDWSSMSWDWVLEGQDELERETQDNSRSPTQTQSALAAMGMEEAHERCEAMLPALSPVSNTSSLPTTAGISGEGTTELLGLGIDTSGLGNSPELTQSPSHQSTSLSVRRPMCSSLACTCEFSCRRLCPLVEEDESEREDEDESEDENEGGIEPASSEDNSTPRYSERKTFLWLLPGKRRMRSSRA
ncbi:unnamed protein product [Tilletia laevis]|uniref:Uncharacterized protein n=3 Tax=Tilletia TaxID=13289 RepID=A0A8X7MUG3_9BASI|nr:hypothetical protein CF336_g2764 [Tilletia laevis]KAE8201236.1 hypothetical protein CF328_g2741 [Tilletia controversa]KAE8240087.1 hypothetical protein A4X03_0g8601 [Tilletia caries]KAE8202403.1 hypothetical protein CF335_g3428 [Tilletia laevis]KAE8248937.1 hypothetical protein A4X06_0g3464 [Tilletia controversa]